ncbi:probable aquaporin NIP7-1 isoform X1 [Juglans microcarpa x Juglans regia]|uniref:probable aquaporin NIP7-1 isoform X1 n=2 Tax=Juglans microcarpa x Juglans regia TaxID=2249226 RepID=UPI001B7E3D12|nr:probable aquaporin NIP7-1 isoform X1 [Juglans microcarpa x Juglans regia]
MFFAPIYLSKRSLKDSVTGLFKVTNSVFLLCKCMRNSIMKSVFEERPPPHISNHASTSGQPKDDQEMGYNAMPKGGGVSNKSAFSCFPQGIDLNLGRVVLAEMVGTFILMFSVCGIIACTQLIRGELGLLEYATTAGLTVVVVIFSIGHISCAHVNPAVTLAFATFGHFPWSKVPFYILAQTLGSVLATCIGQSVYGLKSEILTTRPLHGCSSAFWVELIATFIIMFLAASLTDQYHSIGHLSGFVVGISITLAVLITGPVSGGSMNPARSLGPAIISGKFKDLWIYVTAPVIGAVAGALLYQGLRLQPRSCCPTS